MEVNGFYILLMSHFIFNIFKVGTNKKWKHKYMRYRRLKG